MGPSSLILLAAAVLLAQVFRRRGLSFVGIVLLLLFYTVAMDRWAVGYHGGKLQDDTLAPSTRTQAPVHMAQTFFFRRTALKILTEVGRRSSVPVRVRKSCIRQAIGLKEIADLSEMTFRTEGPLTIGPGKEENIHIIHYRNIDESDPHSAILLKGNIQKLLWEYYPSVQINDALFDLSLAENLPKGVYALNPDGTFKKLNLSLDQLQQAVSTHNHKDGFTSDVWKKEVAPHLVSISKD